MTFEEYQKKAKRTAIYPPAGHKVVYPALGLASEAGEVAGKVKKIVRDDNFAVSDSKRADIAKELGDVLWYTAQVATELDLDLQEIAEDNIKKLQSRQQRGALGGSGDER